MKRPSFPPLRRLAVLVSLPLLAGTALVGSAGAASAAGSTATPSRSGCSTGALPTVVLGNPGVAAHQALGVYVFHTNGHYGVRVTHPGATSITFTGVITTSRPVKVVRRVALEKQDAVVCSANSRTLAFRLVNYGYVDGFDFTADCSRTVHIALRIAGKAATPAQVKLGKARTSPTSVPFTIERAQGSSRARIA